MNARLGVCYYPEHWPEGQWADDARAMAKLGLTYVRIGEFAWSRIEPKPNQFEWAWLDRAVDVLGQAGLKVMLGTPSATPPRWMLHKHPDMLAYDENGQPRKFGSRRHYCFSHEGYAQDCVRIAQKLGERYGDNPHIYGWQIDNEYGCHDTILSYSPAAQDAFRIWLSEKYSSIDALNLAWGNVFWSMEYAEFSDIDLPNLTVTEPNPAHVMDFRRFSSAQTVRFNKLQVDVLRGYTQTPLIHNYMGRITEFDHFEVGADLDIATWDSYPLGFLEDRSDQGDVFKHKYQRQGDPDFQAFHHDLYRAVGKGRWGVMEQQPGPVNWAPFNPAPLPNMVRLWTWEAFAHGAEFVNYFRWKQAPFGQEQMHAALLRPDGKAAAVWPEVAQIAHDICGFDFPEPSQISGGSEMSAAIVFDYASAWAWDTQRQGTGFDYFRLVYDMYRGLRRRGLSVDILPPTTDGFGDRDLVLIPGLFAWSAPLKKAVSKFKGTCLIGPRSGSKTDDFQIPLSLPPNIDGLDVLVTAVETLRPTERIELSLGGYIHIWREHSETSEAISAATSDGAPALISRGNLHYLCGWPDDTALDHVLTKIGAVNTPLPEGVRLRDFGPYRLYTNYNSSAARVGRYHIEPAGIVLIDIKNSKVLIER